MASAAQAASTSQELTWEDDIKPLVQGQCLSCHGLFAGFEQGGYSVATYEATIAGGNNKATHPGVVVGERGVRIGVLKAVVAEVRLFGFARLGAHGLIAHAPGFLQRGGGAVDILKVLDEALETGPDREAVFASKYQLGIGEEQAPA